MFGHSVATIWVLFKREYETDQGRCRFRDHLEASNFDQTIPSDSVDVNLAFCKIKQIKQFSQSFVFLYTGGLTTR